MPPCPLTDKVTLNSPIGVLEITACDDGLHGVELVERNDPLPPSRPSFERKRTEVSESNNHHIRQAVSWLVSYFSAKARRPPSSPILCFSGMTDFQSKVYSSLQTVSSGEVISYQGLSRLAGHQKAARAVGSAMKKNPFLLIVPCHRVVLSTMKVGNFSSGVSVKQWLLDFERFCEK